MGNRVKGGSSPHRAAKYKSHDSIRVRNKIKRIKRCVRKLQKRHKDTEYYLDSKENIRKKVKK